MWRIRGVLALMLMCGIHPLAKGVPTLRMGDYLSEEYISILKQTHSPLQAQRRLDFVIYAKVAMSSAAGVKYEFNIGNFHEGSGPISISADGAVVTVPAASFGLPGATFRLLSDESFLVTLKGETPTKMVYVRDVNRFVASLTIAGEYTDSLGRAVSFRPDGAAAFPDKKRRYIVSTDYPELPECECVFLDDVQYAYKQTEGRLYLYSLTGESSTEIAEKPTWVLKRK